MTSEAIDPCYAKDNKRPLQNCIQKVYCRNADISSYKMYKAEILTQFFSFFNILKDRNKSNKIKLRRLSS